MWCAERAMKRRVSEAFRGHAQCVADTIQQGSKMALLMPLDTRPTVGQEVQFARSTQSRVYFGVCVALSPLDASRVLVSEDPYGNADTGNVYEVEWRTGECVRELHGPPDAIPCRVVFHGSNPYLSIMYVSDAEYSNHFLLQFDAASSERVSMPRRECSLPAGGVDTDIIYVAATDKIHALAAATWTPEHDDDDTCLYQPWVVKDHGDSTVVTAIYDATTYT